MGSLYHNALWRNVLEQFRDFWPLIITIIASPFFVFLYWMMFSGGMNSLSIGIVNLDRGFREKSYSKEWIEILKTQKKNELNVFQITDVKDREVLKSLLKEKKIHAGFVLPEDFSEILEKSKSGKLENTIQAEMTGDMTNPMYLVGVTLVILELESYAYKIAKVKKSFHETGKSPILNNSFFGNGYMEPENHIKIKRGIFPIVNTSFPFLQKLATIKLVP